MVQTFVCIRSSVSTASGSDRVFINSRSKSLSILARGNKRFDHFRTHEVAVELIQLRQPEIIASVVGVRAAVRIAAEVSEELHQDKRAIELLAIQSRVLSHVAQRT